jgi:hypothetical protein
VIRDIKTAIRGVLAKAEPVLVYLAGPNGAGKSTFFKDYLQALKLPFINADDIARRLQESELPAQTENLDRVAFEMAEKLRLSLLHERLSFCTETVFSDSKGPSWSSSSRPAAPVTRSSSSSLDSVIPSCRPHASCNEWRRADMTYRTKSCAAVSKDPDESTKRNLGRERSVSIRQQL